MSYLVGELEKYKTYPHFDRASQEVDDILPPSFSDVEPDDVRALMILAWLRGASWQSHDTN